MYGGSASIPKRWKVTVHYLDYINYNTENMEDEGKMSPLSLSCNESMPHMLVTIINTTFMQNILL